MRFWQGFEGKNFLNKGWIIEIVMNFVRSKNYAILS